MISYLSGLTLPDSRQKEFGYARLIPLSFWKYKMDE